MSERGEDTSGLKILMPDLEGWAIVRYRESVFPYDVIYAEHIKGCNTSFDGRSANWCWEWGDSRPGEVESCWMCKRPVPESVVGLVRLMNWEK